MVLEQFWIFNEIRLVILMMRLFNLLLTNTQVSKFCKAFVNNSLVNLKLSKTHLSKMVQLGGFLGRLLGPLIKNGLP